MKKLINDPGAYVDEALAGMSLAHGGAYEITGLNSRVVVRPKRKPAGQVGVISGGGFGHGSRRVAGDRRSIGRAVGRAQLD